MCISKEWEPRGWQKFPPTKTEVSFPSFKCTEEENITIEDIWEPGTFRIKVTAVKDRTKEEPKISAVERLRSNQSHS